MVSIARKNLFEDIPRFLVAQAGIMFAVSLVTIQTGIFNGVIRSTIVLVEGSRADIWVASKKMVHLELTEPLLYDSVRKTEEIEGVARAEGLNIGSARWSVPNGKLTVIKIFGFNPRKGLFVPGQLLKGKVANLSRQPYTVILDKSKLKSLGVSKIEDRAQIRSLPAKVAGITQDTQSIVASTYIFASLETANAYLSANISSRLDCKWILGDIKCINVYEKVDPDSKPEELKNKLPEPLSINDPILYVLVKAESDENLQQLKRRIEATIPESRAYTKQEMIHKIRTFWQRSTGIGFILGLGAVVGVIVGMVIVGQILYSSVSDHLKEFGTLKAMGASNKIIYGVIVEQALWMAILGYIPGMLLCWGLGTWTLVSQGIVILITPMTAVGVFGITVFMCVGSALFAIQKVSHVDPAIVFKA
ncbi:MAG: FtsX-like permease family protein [Cyanobacteria bacterium P01_A01_bin.45]